MAPGTAFAEMLDRSVGRCEPPAAAGRRPPGIATLPLFWIAGGAVTPRRSPAPLTHPHATPVPLRTSRLGSPRPARRLSRRQREALDRLIGLGARLDVDFTRDELRSAFRTLARIYHPDRHPGMAADGTARLSATFAVLHDAYGQLTLAA